MDPGRARSEWRRPLLLGLILAAATGCAGGGQIDRALLADGAAGHGSFPLNNYYQVHCPDQLEVHVLGKHPWQGLCNVGPDGRIVVGVLGTLRVEGMTPGEVADRLGQQLGVKPEQVAVKVAAYKSQLLYLYGEVAGLQRALAYHGPETVVEVLQRAGGLTPGAAPGEVQVVRTHVADGKQPEVFHVDLPAILLKHEQQSNIRVQPFDQVYIAQSPQSCFAKRLPEWFRPCFERLCGMKSRPDIPGPPTPVPPPAP